MYPLASFDLENMATKQYFDELEFVESKIFWCNGIGEKSCEGSLDDLVKEVYNQFLRLNPTVNLLDEITLDNLSAAYRAICRLQFQKNSLDWSVKLTSKEKYNVKPKVLRRGSFLKNEERLAFIRRYAMNAIPEDLLHKIFSFLPMSKMISTWPCLSKGRSIIQLYSLLICEKKFMFCIWEELRNQNPIVESSKSWQLTFNQELLKVKVKDKYTLTVQPKIDTRCIKRGTIYYGCQYFQTGYLFNLDLDLAINEINVKPIYQEMLDIIDQLGKRCRQKLIDLKIVNKEEFLHALKIEKLKQP